MGVILLDKMNVILKNNNSLVYKSLESFKKMFKENKLIMILLFLTIWLRQLESIKIFGKLS